MFLYEKHWSNDKSFYTVFSVQNLNHPLHFHNTFEINYVLDGEITVILDNKIHVLKKGNGIVIFPKQFHSYNSYNFSKICIIAFSADMISEFVKKYDGLIPENSIIQDLSPFENKFFSKNHFIQKGILYEILGILSNESTFKKGTYNKDMMLLHKILSFVDENYANNCSLHTLSKALTYSYSYISKRFTQYMNMSYTEYLNRYRISRAIQLLTSENNLTVSRICTECGFDSLCTFNRNFKKYTGTTPSNYLLNQK